MAERYGVLADTDLEAALRDLGAAIDVPGIARAGDLDPAARARLRIVQDGADRAAGAGQRRWPGLAPRRQRWRAGRGLVLALIAAAVVAAIAGAIGLGLPGIRIIPAATPSASPTAGSGGPSGAPTASLRPSPTPQATIADPLGSDLGLGRRIAVAHAADQVAIPVTLPTAPGIGAPETAWLLDGRLAFVWRASPTLPATPVPGVGLLLGEFRGSIDEGYLEKVINQGTTIATVRIGDTTGYWISGAPHDIVYVDASGAPQFDSRRSVGDTLLWARGDVTYRLESGLGRDGTVAIAETVR